MGSLDRSPLPHDGTSQRQSSTSAAAPSGPLGRLVPVTDRLVALLPRPLRNLLLRPLTSPPRQQADAVVATVVRWTLLVSAVAFVLLAVTHLVDILALAGRFRAFDADEDGGVWTWASVATQAAGAALLAMMAMSSARRRGYALCSLAVAFLSLDDALLIHERLMLGGRFDFFPHAGRTIFPLLYLPLLVAVSVGLWRIAEAQDWGWTRVLVRGGLVALAVAIGLEAGSPLLFALGQGDNSVGYELEVAIEEGLEMMGWLWVTGGLSLTVLERGGQIFGNRSAV
jgi:hypothetical protein